MATHNAEGEPGFFGCKIECTQAEWEDGQHYEWARFYAAEEGYETPMVAFDENDTAAQAMLDHFNWDAATVYQAGGPRPNKWPDGSYFAVKLEKRMSAYGFANIASVQSAKAAAQHIYDEIRDGIMDDTSVEWDDSEYEAFEIFLTGDVVMPDGTIEHVNLAELDSPPK